MQSGMIDALDGAQGVQAPRMTMGQRQEKWFEKLDLSSLESWPPEQPDSAHLLLAEYDDIFSLESGKLGCTHLTEHVIKVIQTDPSAFGGRSLHTPTRDVRLWCNSP